MNKHYDSLMVIAALGILGILFFPISGEILDTLLILNCSWSLIILLLTFYTDKPLSFSTFPSLLLLSTLFRLSLNISATRLILSKANAGQVIDSIGRWVIHGNYILGLVIFVILIIVQFIVVTNGAQRIAEVAARFTLDSMPGKQMSIDADLNMGIITHEEAKKRRRQIEQEANFYGAMDGASKFVKGDAIAGILILLVDILGGLVMGVGVNQHSFSHALQQYTLLTIGDGLVTQMPAFIISMSTGLIVTRAATDANLSQEVISQLTFSKKSLFIVGACLCILLLIADLPKFPIILSLCFVILGLLIKPATSQPEVQNKAPSLIDRLSIPALEIKYASQHRAIYQTYLSVIEAEIKDFREQIALEFGVIIPPVTFTANLQDMMRCEIFLYGKPIFSQQINHTPEHLIKQFKMSVRQHLNDLLTRENLIARLKTEELKNRYEALVPNLLDLSQLQQILKLLLEEQISIRPLGIILDSLLRYAKDTKDEAILAERIRPDIAAHICHRLTQSQQLPVMMLSSKLEASIAKNIVNNQWNVDPETTEKLITGLANQIELILKQKKHPVLLCASPIRRHIKQITQRLLPALTIIGINEIPFGIHIESLGVIQ